MAKEQARCAGFGIEPYSKFLTFRPATRQSPTAELRARKADCKMDQPIKTKKTVAALPECAYYSLIANSSDVRS
jgi:hypothetical protein